MAPVHRHTSQTSFSQHLQCDSEPARTNTMEITMAVVHRHSVRTSWPQPLQCDSQPITTIALQITMAVTHRTAGGPAATTRRRSPFWRLWVLRLPLQRERGAQRRQRAPQPLLEALGTAPATAEREGGPAATTRAAAILLAGIYNGYCEPARTNAMEIRMAVVPRHSVRTTLRRSPLQCDSQLWVTTIAPANHNGSNEQNRRGPSGDNARRSPFWRL